jgi:hypothetical protein
LAKQLKQRIEIGFERAIPAEQDAQRDSGDDTKTEASARSAEAHQDLRE